MELRSKSSVYHIQNILSEGMTSTVCTAYRKDLNYPVAQKILLKIFKSPSDIYPLELESLLKVRSSYCTSILHFEKIENKPAFILEWAAGLNLFQLLRQSERLNSLEVSYICWSIQQGLMDLRSYGICHGDLSFSNVLIDRKGYIRLIDFGKGNYMGKDLFFTPCFTSPEVFKGESPSFYSDLFSLGILEYLLNQPIDQFKENHWGYHFAIQGHPLLDPLPKNRKIKEFINHQSARLSLAQKVNQIYEKQSYSKIKTLPQTSFSSKKSYKKLFFISFLSLFLFGFAGSSLAPLKTGSLSIRSLQWLAIHIGDKKGFTPFDSGPLPAGRHLLKWKNHKQSGTFIIYIKEDQHLLLTDKDFLKQ